jgi:hypothetical protein
MRTTREIAFAAATDAGNRSMKADGRTVWAVKDYNAAVAELNRLLDHVEVKK